MPGTSGHRSPRRARRWAACAVAAAATAAGLAPLALAHDKPPDGGAPSPCRPYQKGPDRPAALVEIAARARNGVEIAPGAIVAPALAPGRAAEVAVRLGPDPLGVAALLRADPATFWGSARASLSATAPGAVSWAAVHADGSARLTLTPQGPGPVTMRLHLPGRALQRPLGLCPTGAWGIGSALRRQGEAPGSPVLRVEDLPVPAPNPPGPEPAPVPGPEPSP